MRFWRQPEESLDPPECFWRPIACACHVCLPQYLCAYHRTVDMHRTRSLLLLWWLKRGIWPGGGARYIIYAYRSDTWHDKISVLWIINIPSSIFSIKMVSVGELHTVMILRWFSQIKRARDDYKGTKFIIMSKKIKMMMMIKMKMVIIIKQCTWE